MFKEYLDFLPDLLFIIQGSLINLQYASVSVLLGLLLGTCLTICKLSSNKFIKLGANFYTSIFRGTPLLLQLYIMYFGASSLLKINISVFTAGVIAFSLNSAAYVSEIIKAGIISIDKGQLEATQALGIPIFYAYRDIIIPQAIVNILPALVNELINMLKESSLISVLGGMDLMYRAQLIAASTYNYFTPLIIVSLCYYIMVSALNYLADLLFKKLTTI